MIAVRTNQDLAGVCECTFTVYKMAKFSKMKRTLTVKVDEGRDQFFTVH